MRTSPRCSPRLRRSPGRAWPAVLACPSARRSDRSTLSALHSETKLERHLVVVHVPLLGQVAAHLSDLEPIEVTQRLARSAQGDVDRLLDRLRRRSDDLAD